FHSIYTRKQKKPKPERPFSLLCLLEQHTCKAGERTSPGGVISGGDGLDLWFAAPGWIARSMGWSVLKDAYHLKPGRIRERVLFDPHTHLAHHPHGSHIPVRGRRDNPLEGKLRESIVDQ